MCRFPGLKTVLDYIQATLQEQVAMVSGQDYGSFASISGVPLGFEFITSQDVTTGARRSYGQSCLSEPNVLYDVRAPTIASPRSRPLATH